MKKIMIIFGAVLVASTAIVSAFPFTRSWHESATGVAGTNRAGAGGIYGTGGRLDKGIKCSHCHIKGDTPDAQYGKIGMTFVTTPTFTLDGADLKYLPSTKYTFTISLTGEHRGGGGSVVGPLNNKNGMNCTIEDANGARAGRFVADAGQDTNACPMANPYPGMPGAVSPAGKTTFMYGDCHGILPLDHPALTSWTFDWYSPAAGAGDLTLFVGVVDGDTDGNSSLHDDVLVKAIPLRQGP